MNSSSFFNAILFASGPPYYCSFDFCQNVLFYTRNAFYVHFREFYPFLVNYPSSSSESEETLSGGDEVLDAEVEVENFEEQDYMDYMDAHDDSMNEPDQLVQVLYPPVLPVENAEPDQHNHAEEQTYSFTKGEFKEFDFVKMFGQEFLGSKSLNQGDIEKTMKVTAQLATFCKSQYQVAPSCCNKILSLAFTMVKIIVETKEDTVEHLEAAVKVSRSNHMQQVLNETGVHVDEYEINGGKVYHIPIYRTLKCILKLPGVEKMLAKDHERE